MANWGIRVVHHHYYRAFRVEHIHKPGWQTKFTEWPDIGLSWAQRGGAVCSAGRRREDGGAKRLAFATHGRGASYYDLLPLLPRASAMGVSSQFSDRPGAHYWRCKLTCMQVSKVLHIATSLLELACKACPSLRPISNQFALEL